MKIYKPKVAIASDIHAGVHQNSSTWHDVLFNWANWFKQQCEINDIKDIIIPGDLFHERNEVNVNTLHVISKVLESWKNFNIIILVGNHDSYYKDRSDVHSLEMLKHWDNITIIDTIKTDTFFGKTISFCPWASDVSLLPKSDILFGHLEIQGFNVTRERVCEGGESAINLLNIADLIITGHFHIRDERVFEKGTILYTGCAYELYWGDYDTIKGFHILNIPTCTYDFVPNNVSPRHIKLTVSDIKKNGITDVMKNNLMNNWVKVIIDEQVNTDVLIILIEKLKAYKPLDIKIDYTVDPTQINIDSSIDISGVDITKNINEYIKNIDIPHKSLVENYILDLYRKVA
jgi:DNA repair exonuclease SbcCD nuclease subunit